MSHTRDTDQEAQAAEADRLLKQKLRAMWASGDYPALAGELIPELGAVLVEAAGIRPRQKVLDIAAGAGNAAIPAAMMGARVVAADLTAELFDAGRRQAAERGVTLDWVEADAEALPFDDGTFDAVISCVGVMFAPHHQAAADQLVRVCAPGGSIALLNWTPDGFVGQMLAAMKPFAPPPPPGAGAPPEWGNEEHVRQLLGDRVTDVQARRRSLTVRSFHAPEDFVRYFKSHYGPVISVYKHLAGDADKVKALDRALAELAEAFGDAHGDTPFQMEWEYLLLTAKKARPPQAVR